MRACLPLGRHVTIEATATTLLAQFLGDVGFTVHPGSNDDVPYLALRGGIYANVVVGGYAVTPSIGWRFGERYLEAGPLVVFLIDEENEHFDTIVGASLMFGKN